jgi:hypothetical protein
MTAAAGRLGSSSSGVFWSRSRSLPSNGLTGRPLPDNWLSSGAK